MRKVGTDAIVGAVRYRLNEELDNESLALEEAGLYGDDSDLDAVILSHVHEALDYVHTGAPIDGLDGVTLEEGDGYSLSADGTTLDIRLNAEMLRLVSFRSSDTPFNVNEVFYEGSAEGHKQLKPSTRGTWDNPRLIVQADSSDYYQHMRYYSRREADDGDASPVAEFIHIPKQRHGQETYLVCSILEEAFYDYLTGLVLDTYGEHERAQIYAQRALAPTK